MLRTSLVSVWTATLVAAGCGGSGSDFRERATAICEDYDERIEAVASPQNVAELVDTSGSIADLLEEQAAQLRELEPPGEVEGDFDAWLALNDEAIENAREIQAAAREGDQDEINHLAQEAQRNTTRADRLARDMDIPRCMIDERDSGQPTEDEDDGVVTVGTDDGR